MVSGGGLIVAGGAVDAAGCGDLEREDPGLLSVFVVRDVHLPAETDEMF